MLAPNRGGWFVDSGLVGLHMIGALTSESVTISADLLGLGGAVLPGSAKRP